MASNHWKACTLAAVMLATAAAGSWLLLKPKPARVYEFPFEITLADDRPEAWAHATAAALPYRNPVPFPHYQHAVDLRIDCIRCHHDQQAHSPAEDLRCGRCHTAPGLFEWQQSLPDSSPPVPEASEVAPMKPRLRHLGSAFHTLCVGCHQEAQRLDSRTTAHRRCRSCHQPEDGASTALPGFSDLYRLIW